MSEESDPESFWEEVLSGRPGRVRAALAALPPETRAAVVTHLRRMAAETGWSAAQQDRAQAALRALGEASDSPA